MTSYKELLAQREALEKQIKDARKAELAAAIEKVRALCAEYDLNADDVFGKKAARSSTGAKVAAKYKNPQTGETWTGRGKAPKWIEGQDREKFLIQA